jgi:hypothetical protein
VFCGNVALITCQKKKLQKIKVPLQSLADKRVPLSSKMRLINKRGDFIIPLLCAILPTIFIFRITVTKMYLVSPDYVNQNERPIKKSSPPPPSKKTVHKTRVKRKIKQPTPHPYDKWIAVRGKIAEAS